VNFFALIPARSGSERIPGKNLKMIAGKPLIAWTIEAAMQSQELDNVYVSTDSPEIAEVAKHYGASVPFLRPVDLANSESKIQDTIKHFLDVMGFVETKKDSAILLLQPTSPLRNSKHIDSAIELFNNSNRYDCLVSTTRLPSSLNPRKIVQIENNCINSSQTEIWQKVCEKELTSEKIIIRNGSAIYISRLPTARVELVHGNCLHYEMPFLDSIDIDEDSDFVIAELLLNLKLVKD